MKRDQLSLFLAFLTLLSVLAACQSTPQSPQGVMYATLNAASAGIDSYRADYEAAFNAGRLSRAERDRLDAAYNQANEAIIAAARAVRDTSGPIQTPAEVDAAVRALAQLVTTLVAPTTQPPTPVP